jgi:TRAP-type C4-dicarboxylate transport system permease small subunit
MRNWVLHHLHFVIFADAILHLLMIVCAYLAVYYMVRFIQAAWYHEGATKFTRGLSLTAVPIAAYLLVVTQWAFYDCASQYATWWSR